MGESGLPGGLAWRTTVAEGSRVGAAVELGGREAPGIPLVKDYTS